MALHRFSRLLLAIAFAAAIASTAGCALLEQKTFEPGDGLSPDQLSYLVGINAISEGESVQYFSSNLTFEESGNFVTDQGVGSYWLTGNEAEQRLDRARFDEIDSTTLTPGSATNASDILITLTDGSQFHVYVSADADYVDRFHAEIERRVAQS